MNPNGTVSMETSVLENIINSARAKLHKQYAYTPTTVDGKLIWFKSYWVRYEVNGSHLGIFGDKRQPRVIIEKMSAERYLMETISGNIVDNVLLTAKKVKLTRK